MKKIGLLLLLILVHNVECLKLDRLVIASDANENYLPFWPVVAKVWKQLLSVKPTLILVASKNVQVDETVGEVIRFEPIPGIPTSLQAQCVRIFMPAFFPDDVCLVTDIDAIPLSSWWFENLIKSYGDDRFIVYRDRCYPGETKYCLMHVAGKGNIFADIFKIKTIEDVRQRIIEWHKKRIGWSTDETMLTQTVRSWAKFKEKCALLGWGNEPPRIVRGPPFLPLFDVYDEHLLKTGQYVDSMLPRPYKKYKAQIDKIISLLGVNI